MATVQKFMLDNGTEGSRSEYIRQEFNKDRSRQDIAKELGVKYYVVYAATANMYNAAHPQGATGIAGRTSTEVPKVNANFEFIGTNESGEEVVVESADEAILVPRADLMRDLYEAGVERKAIAEHFEVAYATVYAATKGDDVKPVQRVEFEVPAIDEDGNEIPGETRKVKRADYIRELYNDGNGLTRKEIATKLTLLTGELVDYATVFAATKAKKVEETVEEVEVEETVEAE